MQFCQCLAMRCLFSAAKCRLTTAFSVLSIGVHLDDMPKGRQWKHPMFIRSGLRRDRVTDWTELVRATPNGEAENSARASPSRSMLLGAGSHSRRYLGQMRPVPLLP